MLGYLTSLINCHDFYVKEECFLLSQKNHFTYMYKCQVVIKKNNIVYTGEGVISDKQGQGWLVRMLDDVWPF